MQNHATSPALQPVLEGRDASMAAHPARGQSATTPDGTPLYQPLTRAQQEDLAWAAYERPKPNADGPGGRLIAGH